MGSEAAEMLWNGLRNSSDSVFLDLAFCRWDTDAFALRRGWEAEDDQRDARSEQGIGREKSTILWVNDSLFRADSGRCNILSITRSRSMFTVEERFGWQRDDAFTGNTRFGPAPASIMKPLPTMLQSQRSLRSFASVRSCVCLYLQSWELPIIARCFLAL